MKNKICASIITYNIDNKIINVVNSIINQVDLVVIVDNASKTETKMILNDLEKLDKVKVIFNLENVGIAKALNQGVKYAEAKGMDWIITLDHDSICDENMIENMFKAYYMYNKLESVGILTPKIYEINKNDFISKKHSSEEIYIEVKDCIQSGSIYKLDLFKKIGYFNESLFIYHVDYDLCEKVLKSGYKILQCNNTILHHEEGYKIPKRFLGKTIFYNNYSGMAIYYITRNTVYMSKKYNILYSKRIVKDLIHIILYDKNRWELLLYWSRGLKDGLLNRYGKLVN